MTYENRERLTIVTELLRTREVHSTRVFIPMAYANDLGHWHTNYTKGICHWHTNYTNGICQWHT